MWVHLHLYIILIRLLIWSYMHIFLQTTYIQHGWHGFLFPNKHAFPSLSFVWQLLLSRPPSFSNVLEPDCAKGPQAAHGRDGYCQDWDPLGLQTPSPSKYPESESVSSPGVSKTFKTSTSQSLQKPRLVDPYKYSKIQPSSKNKQAESQKYIVACLFVPLLWDDFVCFHHT